MITLDHNSPTGNYVLELRYGGTEIGNVSFQVVKPDLPDWIKANARDWSSGSVTEKSFAETLQFLIEEGIIEGPEKEPLETTVPSWLKNMVRWWTDGQISDEGFLNSIEYLVKKDIIRV